MHGNVYQSVQDRYHDTYQGARTDGSAWVTSCTEAGGRVLRGGSWLSFLPQFLRAANRIGDASDIRVDLHGFRVARTLNP